MKMHLKMSSSVLILLPGNQEVISRLDDDLVGSKILLYELGELELIDWLIEFDTILDSERWHNYDNPKLCRYISGGSDFNP